MLEWIKHHEILLASLGGFGFLLFIVSLVAIPVIVACMREDYFIRVKSGTLRRGPLRQFGHILKNILGVCLVLCGILLLLLPGQGILMILIGLSLVDFPGKHQLQIRIVQIRSVRQSISWIRHHAGRQDLLIPEKSSGNTTPDDNPPNR